MKKCFKFLGLMLLATTLTIAYTSCGGDDDDTTTTNNQEEPDPGPGPGPGPDPEPNPFEGMEAGQVRAKFSGDGSDTLYTKVFRNFYAEQPQLRQLVLWGTRAESPHPNGDNYFNPPYFSCLASLDSCKGWEFYCEYYTGGGWQTVIVTYTSGAKDTHQVGNYVYVGSLWGGPITVDKVSYNSLRKVLTAKVVIPLAKTADIIGDAAGNFNPNANPEIQNLTLLYYKVPMDDQFPSGTKNLLGNDKFFGTKLKSKIRVR